MAFGYAALARRIVAASFDAHKLFPGLSGAELRDLVQQVGNDLEVDYVLDGDKEDQRLERLRGHVERLIAGYDSRRMLPPLRQDPQLVTWFEFKLVDLPGEGDEIRGQLARLRLHTALLEHLQALGHNDFELLCGKLLELIGCTAVYVTRSSKDWGVDFLGRMPVAAREGDVELGAAARVLGGLFFFLLGQAKRYAAYNKIDHDTVKVLLGTAADVRSRRAGDSDVELAPELRKGLDAIGFKRADPTLLLFVTTSFFTGPAQDVVRANGIVSLDGEQVAQLLLESGRACEAVSVSEWKTDKAMLIAFCQG